MIDAAGSGPQPEGPSTARRPTASTGRGCSRTSPCSLVRQAGVVAEPRVITAGPVVPAGRPVLAVLRALRSCGAGCSGGPAGLAVRSVRGPLVLRARSPRSPRLVPAGLAVLPSRLGPGRRLGLAPPPVPAVRLGPVVLRLRLHPLLRSLPPVPAVRPGLDGPSAPVARLAPVAPAAPAGPCGPAGPCALGTGCTVAAGRPRRSLLVRPGPAAPPVPAVQLVPRTGSYRPDRS